MTHLNTVKARFSPSFRVCYSTLAICSFSNRNASFEFDLCDVTSNLKDAEEKTNSEVRYDESDEQGGQVNPSHQYGSTSMGKKIPYTSSNFQIRFDFSGMK